MSERHVKMEQTAFGFEQFHTMIANPRRPFPGGHHRFMANSTVGCISSKMTVWMRMDVEFVVILRMTGTRFFRNMCEKIVILENDVCKQESSSHRSALERAM